MLELLTIISSILELYSIYLLGLKNKYGFVVGIFGSIGWIIYTLLSGSAVGLWIICPVCILLNIRNFMLWSKDDQKSETGCTCCNPVSK
jgi:uncharacterized membrane protein